MGKWRGLQVAALAQRQLSVVQNTDIQTPGTGAAWARITDLAVCSWPSLNSLSLSFLIWQMELRATYQVCCEDSSRPRT